MWGKRVTVRSPHGSPGAALHRLACVVLIAVGFTYFVRFVYRLYSEEIRHTKSLGAYAQFVAYEVASQLEPRYEIRSAQIPIWVISMPKSRLRRAAIEAQMQEQDLAFEFFDAVNGYQADRGEGPHVSLRDRYFPPDHKQFPGNVGNFLSHVRLMQRIVAESADVAVIAEDDIALSPGFAPALRRALAGLPASWDLLYLNVCEQRWKKAGAAWGGRATPHARHARRPTCTIGLAVSYTGALRVLEALARGVPRRINGPIDIEYIRLIRAGALHAFVADPPLCGWQPEADVSSKDCGEEGVPEACTPPKPPAAPAIRRWGWWGRRA